MDWFVTNQRITNSAPNLIKKHGFLCLSPKHGFTTWLGFSKVWDFRGLNQGSSQGRNLLQPQPDKITVSIHGGDT
jgi:hypothetical protein